MPQYANIGETLHCSECKLDIPRHAVVVEGDRDSGHYSEFCPRCDTMINCRMTLICKITGTSNEI